MYHTRYPITFTCECLIASTNASFRHTFHRCSTNRHFGSCSCPHSVCHTGMAAAHRPERASACPVDEFVEVVVAREQFAAVPVLMWRQCVDGLSQLTRRPLALDMVHIFHKKNRNSIWLFGRRQSSG